MIKTTDIELQAKSMSLPKGPAIKRKYYVRSEFFRKFALSVFDVQWWQAVVDSCSSAINWTFDAIWALAVAHVSG